MPLKFYSLPHWSNPPFFGRTELQIAQMSEIKNSGLDQHCAKPFQQRQFGTAGTEGVT